MVNKGKGPRTLLLQDDGNLAYYGFGCKQWWQSNSARI